MQSALDRIGIVGASGYIGGALSQALVEADGSPRLFGRRVDKVAGLDMGALTPDSDQFSGLDSIVHLSGITSSRASEAELNRVNVDLAANVARMAAEAKVKRFVFVSSLAVYGKSSEHPVSPSTPPRPDNAYGRSKSAAESAVLHALSASDTVPIVVRPPMIYGPGSRGSFAQLARVVRTGLPLPFRSAHAPRSFCSIGNLVSALRHCVERIDASSMFFPADPEDFTTAALIETMADAQGRKVVLWPAPKRLLEAPLALVGRSEMVTSLFEPLPIDRTHWQALSWSPVETGEEGVRRAISAT